MRHKPEHNKYFGRLLIALLALVTLGSGMAWAGETYRIDTAHSAVGFKVRHLFSHTSGRFTDFSGKLVYDAEKPVNSSIELMINAASIDTDNDTRDNHLRSNDFLHIEAHPQITFKSTRIAETGKPNHFDVTGDLTIRGVTRAVTVAVEILGFGEFPGMGHRGGFNASTTINRQDFGVKWNKLLDAGGTLLGNDVHIDCPIEVVRQ